MLIPSPSSHRDQCRALAEQLPHCPQPGPVFVGFDGFIDHIIAVVDQRSGAQTFSRIPTIAALASRLAAAAGQSTNLELVIERSKIGGNGPIMGAALAAQGAPLTLVGLLGDNGIHPIFSSEVQANTRLISLGSPAITDALEFRDGKIMLGKLEPLAGITAEALEHACGGRPGLRAILTDAKLIATVNWTMALGMTAIWRHLSANVLPGLFARSRPWLFVDLADPNKRPIEELKAGLDALTELQHHVRVILGLNGAEAKQVCRSLDLACPAALHDGAAAAPVCMAIAERLGISMVMCHMTGSAASAWRALEPAAQGPGFGHSGMAAAAGFLCSTPLITTGAGDHFNAGFTSGLLMGLAPADALLLGGATSGSYVRSGRSPDRAGLIGFLHAWDSDAAAAK